MPEARQHNPGGWWRRRFPKTRVGRVSFWLFAASCALLVVSAATNMHGLTSLLMVLCWVCLAPLVLVLLLRWFTRVFLWKVRNRLILTYLLMGLAPVILFATLAGIAGYLFIGQFATNTALAVIDRASSELPNEADHGADQRSLSSGKGVFVAVLRHGVWTPLPGSSPAAAFPPSDAAPAWPRAGFHGIIADNGILYMAAVSAETEHDSPVLVLTCRPLDQAELESLAHGLGKLYLSTGFHASQHDSNVYIEDAERPEKSDLPDGDLPNGEAGKKAGQKDTKLPGRGFDSVSAGALPPSQHVFDIPVLFSAPLPVTSWKSGEQVNSLVTVVSRPTVLYGHLFANSVVFGRAVRIALLSIALAFAVLELFALLMALGLSHTITGAVKELSRGTTEIDRGNLAYRIRVGRKDQLGALATAFNTMAGSIQQLLLHQRERDRLLNELAIAHQVQANLFPHSPLSLPGFELHAVCLPARSVSGDYFDFITGSPAGLWITLGDISGKGISAALLMASLHSAVRAFSLDSAHDGAEPLSPGRLLAVLNRHLYQNTQAEKYATLFLAVYDHKTYRLTYSNGGHLPPVILRQDGTVKHLDCGGSVVGLMNGLEYDEETVQLQPGDLLVGFSDGLTEPENAQEAEFGESRLLDCIRSGTDQSLPGLATTTFEALQKWIGQGEQPDDMTILLCRLS